MLNNERIKEAEKNGKNSTKKKATNSRKKNIPLF